MRNRYLMGLDVVAFAAAVWTAFAFRFGWLFHADRPEFMPLLLAAVGVKASVFVLFGIYSRYWRYATFDDLLTLVLANVVGAVALGGSAVGLRVFEFIPGLSRTIPLLDAVFATVFTAGIRASVRAIGEARAVSRRGAAGHSRRVLVAGAGDAGTLMVREMQRNPQLGCIPVGFLDDDGAKDGKQIYGVRVLGRLEQLSQVCANERIEEVVIAMPTADGASIRMLAEQCRMADIAFRVMPGIFELLDGKISVSRLRKVEIGDLLRRRQLLPGSEGTDYLSGARVLVTGAGGSIGSELCRQIAASGPEQLVLVGHGENSVFDIAAELRGRFPRLAVAAVIADVRESRRIDRVFRNVRPTVVFHAAAHKHVPLMEDNPVEAITNNLGGTRNVVRAAVAEGVRHFVMVSTDKAAAPSNIMGASKRLAEMVVHDAARVHCLPYVAVRFGNVLGSRGSVVPTFKRQIEEGGPLTVTHPEVRRYFMTIPEAVHLILQAGGIGEGGELFVLDMGEPVRLQDLAADMVRLSGLSEQDVPIVFTGLRPGEKLDEVLWEDGALVEPSKAAGIRRVREPSPVEPERLEALLDGLLLAAERHDVVSMYATLRASLPTSTLKAPPQVPTAGPSAVVRMPAS